MTVHGYIVAGVLAVLLVATWLAVEVQRWRDHRRQDAAYRASLDASRAEPGDGVDRLRRPW